MSAVLQGVGGAFQAASQLKQGQIAEAQGRFEEKIALRNQQALNRQANAEIEASKVEEQRISRRSKITQAQIRVNQVGKSGIEIKGATVAALLDIANQFTVDRSLALRTGLIRSRELIQKGKIIAAGGRFAKVIGKSRRKAFQLAALGTALGTAGSVSGGTSGTVSTSPTSSQSGRTAIGSSTRNFAQSSFR